MSKKQFDDFDGFAESYRDIHNDSVRFSGGDSDHFSELKIEILRELEPEASPAMLDLGCGDGNSAIFFRKHFPTSRYFGVDTSKNSIEAAEARNLARATFLHYDGLKLPFEDHTFDVVFIACVLHHIDRDLHETVLAEVRRVLVPNGRLYIFEHNPLNPVTRQVVNNCPFDADAVLLPAGYTRKLLRGTGMTEASTGYIVFFPRHRIFRPILFVENYLRWLPAGGQYYTRSLKPAL
jgi:ubiquinone/menaquinone biosynthesis C-methylase UbiE